MNIFRTKNRLVRLREGGKNSGVGRGLSNHFSVSTIYKENLFPIELDDKVSASGRRDSRSSSRLTTALPGSGTIVRSVVLQSLASTSSCPPTCRKRSRMPACTRWLIGQIFISTYSTACLRRLNAATCLPSSRIFMAWRTCFLISPTSSFGRSLSSTFRGGQVLEEEK